MVPKELSPSWRFKSDSLAGYISGGHEHGIHLTEGVDGNPVTRPMCLNVEHYYAKSQGGGRFVPRYKADIETEQADDGTVVVRINAFEEWSVCATISYKILPERIFEARFEFVFGAAYQDFEAFISNYFPAPAEPFVHVGGEWIQTNLGDREHRYWARNERDAQVITDGRLDEGLAELKGDYDIPVDSLPYDYPIMITPIGESEWSIIHVVEQEMCPSLSANRTWNAHDFSLIGHDVDKGQRIICRAWMVYTKLESPDDAISLYDCLNGETA